ncbi:MAG: hypothetical protein R2729_22065 [Bryobacteraceae bacterium]
MNIHQRSIRWAVASSLAVSMAMPLPAGTAPGQVTGGQQPAAAPAYKIEILSAAGRPRRRQNMVSSESVIRVTDRNDKPVAGVAVMFTLNNITGGSASFANGASSSIVTTNSLGVASTGEVTAGQTSAFNISASASVPGQAPVTVTIPVNMATVGTGAVAGGAVAGGTTGAGGGISGAVIGLIVGVGAAAAVAAAVALGGGNDTPSPTPTPTPTNPRIRIGGPGTPTVTGPR